METLSNILITVSEDNTTSNNTETVYMLTDEYGHPIYGYPV